MWPSIYLIQPFEVMIEVIVKTTLPTKTIYTMYLYLYFHSSSFKDSLSSVKNTLALMPIFLTESSCLFEFMLTEQIS
jgi:hypothetical protein